MFDKIKTRLSKEAVEATKTEVSRQIKAQTQHIETYIPAAFAVLSGVSAIVSMSKTRPLQSAAGKWINIENYGEIHIHPDDITKGVFTNGRR